MLIAQAPGEHEDREDRMFIGPSGKILDELLTTVDIQRREIYMTNLIKCMLPKNRNPKSDEIASCSPYLDREIELIDPKILASLGYYATRYILEKYGVPLPPKPEFREVYGPSILGVISYTLSMDSIGHGVKRWLQAPISNWGHAVLSKNAQYPGLL
jgi:DNA polymerase